MLKIYSLKVDDIYDLPDNSELILKIDSMIDEERARILKRMVNNSMGRATARGVGLLLQYAGSQKLAGTDESINELNLEQILTSVDKVVNYHYRYGKEGKPYWLDESLPFFNVSHSSDRVIIALSDKEIGIDLQKIKGKNELNMARRFYSDREVALIEATIEEKCELFYKLWARKEALGKCTGKGVRPYLDTDVSVLESEYLKQFIWNESRIDDYFVCVCREK